MMEFSTAIGFLVVFSCISSSRQEIYRISQYVVKNTNQMCPSREKLRMVRNSASYEIKAALNLSDSDPSHPCRAEDGWRIIADVDMTDNSQICPQGLTLYTAPLRLCGRRLDTTYDFCEGTTFSVGGISYSNVCGRITGYQVNQGYSFWGRTDIDHAYVDGVSITHGTAGRRQHIWTFVVAGDNENTGISYCPVNGSGLPPFITNDYFCDSGNIPGSNQTNGVYITHTLWDGLDCEGDPYNPPRCFINNPPWFKKVLPRATTNDVELRICGYSNIRWGDTYLQKIELYVK